MGEKECVINIIIILNERLKYCYLIVPNCTV